MRIIAHLLEMRRRRAGAGPDARGACGVPPRRPAGPAGRPPAGRSAGRRAGPRAGGPARRRSGLRAWWLASRPAGRPGKRWRAFGIGRCAGRPAGRPTRCQDGSQAAGFVMLRGRQMQQMSCKSTGINMLKGKYAKKHNLFEDVATPLRIFAVPKMR